MLGSRILALIIFEGFREESVGGLKDFSSVNASQGLGLEQWSGVGTGVSTMPGLGLVWEVDQDLVKAARPLDTEHDWSPRKDEANAHVVAK